MRRRARARTDRHHVPHILRVHDSPVVRLLSAHAEPHHGQQPVHPQVLRQQLVLRPHHVRVPQLAGLREERLVAVAGTLAVAEHRHHHDVVFGQRVVGAAGQRQRRVDVPAVACRDEDRAGRRLRVEAPIGDFDVVQCRPGREGEFRDRVVFDPRRVVCWWLRHGGEWRPQLFDAALVDR